MSGSSPLEKLKRFAPFFPGATLFADYVPIYGKKPLGKMIKVVVVDLPLGLVDPEYPYPFTGAGIDRIHQAKKSASIPRAGISAKPFQPVYQLSLYSLPARQGGSW